MEFSSAAAPLLFKALGNHSVHFLFIDGLHTYQGDVNDITDFMPLVAAGGVVIFSDYGCGFTGATRHLLLRNWATARFVATAAPDFFWGVAAVEQGHG